MNQPVSGELSQEQKEKLRFSCSDSTNTVIKGVLVNEPTGSVEKPVALQQLIPGGGLHAQPCYQQLPYGESFRFIEKLEQISRQSFIALCQPAENHPFFEDSLSSWWGLEYAAQALACFGVLQSDVREMRQCLVVAVKTMQLEAVSIHLSTEPLTVAARFTAQQEDAASCKFTLYQGERIICSGQFNVVYK